jgi:hypothetical protein
MQLHRTFITFSLTGGLALASSLAVYQDSSFYTYLPENNTFIGFTDNITAKCKGGLVVLERRVDCPEDERLCKELHSVKKRSQDLKAIQANISVLNTLVSLPQPTSFEVEKWIDVAQRIGKEQARLSREETRLKKEYLLQAQYFKKQAPSQQPFYLQRECPGDLTLELPYGEIEFSTYYEADIAEGGKVEVQQYLSVTNQSGIDMEANEAMFYYRPAGRYISPVHFSPWIVRKYVPRPKPNYVETHIPRALLMKEQAVADMPAAVTVDNVPAPVAKYLSARSYQIEDLSLPSTGEPVNVEVTSWKVPLKCELRAYPYKKHTAFRVCSFKPKTQIENNRWKIRKGERIVNERAVGEYDEGIYRLYTEADLDVKIERKALVKRERSTGIFGNTIRKKDGYTLTLTNKSGKSKEMIVTERIPTSATEEIKVKLLSVKSKKKVDYKVSKEGKIEMDISLNAHEVKKIEVLFEISYDKALKINY